MLVVVVAVARIMYDNTGGVEAEMLDIISLLLGYFVGR